MRFDIRATALLALIMSLVLSVDALAAQSAEINPFAPTIDQVNSRFLRIEQEVDRLRAAGLNNAADLMAGKLQHFKDQLAGRAPSLISGPELDVVSVYGGSAAGGIASVLVHRTERPVVLALTSYETVQWTVSLAPGASLSRIIVAGYEGAFPPANVPANVPVEVYSYATHGGAYSFNLYDRLEREYPLRLQRLINLTGLFPSTSQEEFRYAGTPLAVGAGSAEWAAQRVLTEMHPLYKEATAFQLAQDREAADQFRFTGLYTTYSKDGSSISTRLAEMTPLRAINVFSPLVTSSVAVDPRGPTYYSTTNSGTPVKYNPVTGQTTPLDTSLPNVLERAGGLTFDTKRNRLLMINVTGESSQSGFLFFHPDDGSWSSIKFPFGTQNFPRSMTYSAAFDAYFGLMQDFAGTVNLLRYDPIDLRTSEIELSQFIRCASITCRLTAAGDQLVLMQAPVVDLYEPLLPPLPHSYLIDPATGNVTLLGALPEPQGLLVLLGACAALFRRLRATHQMTKPE
jgi:hypothetical protein